MSPSRQRLPGLDVSRGGSRGLRGRGLRDAVRDVHLVGVEAGVRERVEVANDHDALHGRGHGGSGRVGIHVGQGETKGCFWAHP